MLGLGGMGSRRLFVLLPKEGEPVAVVHKIEMQPLEGFPGKLLPYAKWEELHAALGVDREGADAWPWRFPRTTRSPISTGCRPAWSS